MKTTTYKLRDTSSRRVDWKEYFDALKKSDKCDRRFRRPVPVGRILKGEFNMRRIIAKKELRRWSRARREFLIEWEGYDISEASWENENHLPSNMMTWFTFPDVSSDVARLVGRTFEKAVFNALLSGAGNNKTHSIDFPLDVFRYCFPENIEYHKDLHKENFSKLSMSSHWDHVIKTINSERSCVQIIFPMTLKPRLTFRSVRVLSSDENRRCVMKKIPIERVTFKLNTSATPLRQLCK